MPCCTNPSNTAGLLPPPHPLQRCNEPHLKCQLFRFLNSTAPLLARLPSPRLKGIDALLRQHRRAHYSCVPNTQIHPSLVRLCASFSSLLTNTVPFSLIILLPRTLHGKTVAPVWITSLTPASRHQSRANIKNTPSSRGRVPFLRFLFVSYPNPMNNPSTKSTPIGPPFWPVLVSQLPRDSYPLLSYIHSSSNK